MPMLAQVQLHVLPGGIPPGPLYFFVFWGAAFVSLSLAVAGSAILSAVLESDAELLSWTREGILAGIASLIEGGSVWLLAVFVPTAAYRAVVIPAVIVALLYQVAHFDTWGRTDAIQLILFQGVFVFVGLAFFLGHVLFGLVVLGIFVVFVALFANLVRSIW